MWDIFLVIIGTAVGLLAATALVVKNITDILEGVHKTCNLLARIWRWFFPRTANIKVISAPSSPTVVGQNVSLSINITSSTGTPSGTVAVYESSVDPAKLIVGPLALNPSGTVAAPLVIPADHLRVGTNCYTVDYSGDSQFKTSHQTISHNVKPKPAKPFIARICWNTNQWEKPSGGPKPGNSPFLFYVLYGFGFEEWLFSSQYLRDGWRYGFVQGVSCHAPIAEPDIFLAVYAIGPCDNGGNAKYLIGRMKCRVLSRTEADDALEYFKQTGAIEEMRTHVVAIKGDVNQFDKWIRPGSGIFNLRYKPADLVVWNPPVELPNGLFIPPLGRFQELRPLGNEQIEAVKQLLSHQAVKSIT